MRHGDTLLPGKHEPIISTDVFDCVQSLHARRRRGGRRGSTAGHLHPYVAASLARCTCCRERLRSQGFSDKSPSYRCSSHDRHSACTAQRRSIPASAVDRDLRMFVSRLRLPDDWQALVLSEIQETESDAVQVERERKRIQNETENIQHYLLSGYITEEQFRARRSELQAELAALAPTAEEVIDLDDAAARLRDLGRVWADADDDQERQDIARAFFEAVYCDLDRKQVVAVKMKSTLSPFKSVLYLNETIGLDVPEEALGCRNAEPTGFEPAISCVTGRHVRPLHHGSKARPNGHAC